MTDAEVADAAHLAAKLADERYQATRDYLGEERASANRYHAVVSVAVVRAAPPTEPGNAYSALTSLVTHATEHMDARRPASWAPRFSGRASAEANLANVDYFAVQVYADRVDAVLRIIDATGIAFPDDGRTVRELGAFVTTVRAAAPQEIGSQR